MEGSTNSPPAMIPPHFPFRSQPMYVASCCASGPGRSMQKFNAWRKWSSAIHFFFSTRSLCIIAIWPVGPPKLMNPSFSQ